VLDYVRLHLQANTSYLNFNKLIILSSANNFFVTEYRNGIQKICIAEKQSTMKDHKHTKEDCHSNGPKAAAFVHWM
jgi:hypothetical protein